VGTTNNSKARRRLTAAVDRLRFVPGRSLEHGRNRLSATGVIMLFEKGGEYG